MSQEGGFEAYAYTTHRIRTGDLADAVLMGAFASAFRDIIAERELDRTERQHRDARVIARWVAEGGEPTIAILDALNRRDPDSILLHDAINRWRYAHSSAYRLPPPFWRPQHPAASETHANSQQPTADTGATPQ